MKIEHSSFALHCSPGWRSRQAGRSLLELALTLVILLLLVVVGLQWMRGLIIEHRAPPAALDMKTSVAKIRSAYGFGVSSAPYADVSLYTLSAFLRTPNFSIQASGGLPVALYHQLGSGNGPATIDVGSFTSTQPADTFQVVFNNLGAKACQPLGVLLSADSELVQVNPSNGTWMTVKNPSVPLSANALSLFCVENASIRFVFR